jgi:hypothetical protein
MKQTLAGLEDTNQDDVPRDNSAVVHQCERRPFLTHSGIIGGVLNLISFRHIVSDGQDCPMRIQSMVVLPGRLLHPVCFEDVLRCAYASIHCISEMIQSIKFPRKMLYEATHASVLQTRHPCISKITR